MLSVEGNVNRLWDLDTMDIRQEDEAHEEFIDKIMFTGTEYSVELPWEVGHDKLPSNYANCLMRLQGQIRKFKKDPHAFDNCNMVVDSNWKRGVSKRFQGWMRNKMYITCLVRQ